MTSIPYNKKRLDDIVAQISETRSILSAQLGLKDAIIADIQKECSHPIEFLNKELTNPERDPLEAKHYRETCEACGKRLREYSIVRGNEYGVKEY